MNKTKKGYNIISLNINGVNIQSTDEIAEDFNNFSSGQIKIGRKNCHFVVLTDVMFHVIKYIYIYFPLHPFKPLI